MTAPVVNTNSIVTPLEGHGGFFAGEDCLITMSSIRKAFGDLGYNPVTGALAAFAFRIAGRIPTDGRPDLIRPSVENPVASGIFDEKGNTSDSLVAKLWTYDMNGDGISQDEFNSFLSDRAVVASERRSAENNGNLVSQAFNGIGNTLSGVVGRITSILEARLLFQIAPDKCAADGVTPVMSLDRLNEFYRNSDKLFKEVATQVEIHGSQPSPCNPKPNKDEL